MIGMSDPRNVAHAKKVTQEKHHQEAKRVAKPRKDKERPVLQQNQPAEAAPTSASPNVPKEMPTTSQMICRLRSHIFPNLALPNQVLRLILPLPLGEGWGEGLEASEMNS